MSEIKTAAEIVARWFDDGYEAGKLDPAVLLEQLRPAIEAEAASSAVADWLASPEAEWAIYDALPDGYDEWRPFWRRSDESDGWSLVIRGTELARHIATRLRDIRARGGVHFDDPTRPGLATNGAGEIIGWTVDPEAAAETRE